MNAYAYDNDNGIEYDDNEIEASDDRLDDNDESQNENQTNRLGAAIVKKKHGSTIDRATVSATPLDTDLLPTAQDSDADDVESEELEPELPRAVAPATAKQQIKEKLADAQKQFGKLPKEQKTPANDNFRPTVSWPLMDQLTRSSFEPDRERRTKNIVSARYLRELIDTVEADSLGSSVHLPGKSAPTDFDVQRTDSGGVYFEHGQTLDRRKVTYETKNGELDAERYSGSLRTAKKSLPVGNSGFDLPFPVRVLAAREELEAVIVGVGPLWPFLSQAISHDVTMTHIGVRLGVKRYQAPGYGTVIIRLALTAAMDALNRFNELKDEPVRSVPMPEKSRGHFLNLTRGPVIAKNGNRNAA
jgi:hypothetical protein